MNLSALLLLRNIFSLITNPQPPTSNGNGNTSSANSPSTSPPSTPSLLPRQGFTDPNLISQPITFYETVTALLLSAGRTYTSIYVDLISATAAFPVNPSPSTTSPATTSTTPLSTTEGSETTSAELKSEGVATTRPEPGGGVLISTITSDITLPPPTTSKTPTTSTSTSSDTSPVLNLAPCSTFTAGVDDPALEGCISSVISALSLTGGGPIIASSTSSSSSSSTVATTTTAAITTVTPTRTVTLPYLGAVVAKGEATFVVGGGGGGVENKGVRVRGKGGGRGLLVVVIAVAVGMMVWWGG